MNALDLIDSPIVSTESFTRAVAIIQANYGAEYAPEKIALLFDMIRDEEWSQERFDRTLKWFLKNKKFSSWTIADWFDFGIRVYPYSWVLNKWTKEGWGKDDYVSYKLPDGTIVYKANDGEELPFERHKI